jgi:hypothetical protein
MIRIIAAVLLPKFKLTHYAGSAALYSWSKIEQARNFSRTDQTSLFELRGHLLAIATTGGLKVRLESTLGEKCAGWGHTGMDPRGEIDAQS